MPLNDQREWANDVAEIVTDTNRAPQPRVKDAFFQGKAHKRRLDIGFKLYKFNDYSTLNRDMAAAAVISPWWSPYNDYEHDPGWEGRVRFAQFQRVSIRELGRLTSVIKENWNSLSYLMIIELSQPVFAFWGTFAGMARRDMLRPSKAVTANPSAVVNFVSEGSGRTANLPGAGGASQFYIPGLTVGDVATWHAESLLGS